jgi:hypothetical protein
LGWNENGGGIMGVLSPPTGLTYTQNSLGNTVLKWYPISGAISYNVYRRLDPLIFYTSSINQSPILTNTYTDISPVVNQVNYYSVTTLNASGESFPSQILVVDLTPQNGLPRVDPHEFKLEKLISERGYQVLWERAMSCPCNYAGQKVTDASDLDHALCKNKQHIWFPESVITVLITRMKRESELNQDAIWEAGVFFISSMAKNKLGFYDRLTFQDSTVPFSQPILKGASGGTDILRFPAVDIALPIIDFDGNKYQFNTDFGLDASGNIQWGGFSGTQPSTGKSYSVVYLTNPRILVVDYPHAIRGQLTQNFSPVPTYQDFPIQTMGKLEFFFDE